MFPIFHNSSTLTITKQQQVDDYKNLTSYSSSYLLVLHLLRIFFIHLVSYFKWEFSLPIILCLSVYSIVCLLDFLNTRNAS